jgi:hypothetical protein
MEDPILRFCSLNITDDRRQVMAKAHMAFWPGELITKVSCKMHQYLKMSLMTHYPDSKLTSLNAVLSIEATNIYFIVTIVKSNRRIEKAALGTLSPLIQVKIECEQQVTKPPR